MWANFLGKNLARGIFFFLYKTGKELFLTLKTTLSCAVDFFFFNLVCVTNICEELCTGKCHILITTLL